MPVSSSARAWPRAKRIVHWMIAAAVVVAALAPKPGDGGGQLHVTAGALALALVVLRIVWRIVGDIPPSLASAYSLRVPASWTDPGKAARSLTFQAARLAGFLVFPGVAIVTGLGLTAVNFGGESAASEAHQVIAGVLIAVIGAHVALTLAGAILSRRDLVAETITGRRHGEMLPATSDGKKPRLGFAAGAAAGLAVFASAWGGVGLQDATATFKDEAETEFAEDD